MFDQIADGRTDLVFDYMNDDHDAASEDSNGVSLIQWCAYYGDVSAIRFLLTGGESLDSLGDNYDLNGAAFHGHWQLCQYLIEQGADVNRVLPETGEAPLHSALCRADCLTANQVVRVLIANGANPNAVTKKSVETGSFMRDSRTRGETPLHRAAAFGIEETITILIDAGAQLDAEDMNGDTPLSWASWYQRSTAILRKLCYGDFKVNAEKLPMEVYLQGTPHF